MSAECLEIIGNSDIIALNQDANVRRAKLVLQYPNPLPFGANTTWVPPQAPPPPEGEPKPPKNATTRGVEIKLQVWVKPLANGDVGVVAFNRQQNDSIVAHITPAMLGLGGRSADVRDLWLHRSVGQKGRGYSAAVAPMDSLALRFTPHSQEEEQEQEQEQVEQEEEQEKHGAELEQEEEQEHEQKEAPPPPGLVSIAFPSSEMQAFRGSPSAPHGYYNARIPAVVLAEETLVAMGECSHCAPGCKASVGWTADICSKRSRDSGLTWTNLSIVAVDGS